MKTKEEIAAYLEETMVHVEGGTFMMGSEKEEEETLHKVNLDSFQICKYPVTQEFYQAITNNNPSHFNFNPHNPVEQVNWYDAVAFCNLLSLAMQLTPVYIIDGQVKIDIEEYKDYEVEENPNANGFRLPTEAQWEYAARGGNVETNYSSSMQKKFAGSNEIDEVAWYDDNSLEETKPVGLKKANQLGLYDMSGNVWEWCWDWFDSYEKSEQSLVNPKGPEEGSYRVSRGGSWFYVPSNARVVYRYGSHPDIRNFNCGFRLSRTK